MILDVAVRYTHKSVMHTNMIANIGVNDLGLLQVSSPFFRWTGNAAQAYKHGSTIT